MKSRIYWKSTKADDKIIKNLKDSCCRLASVSAIFLPGPFPTSSVSLFLSLSVCRSALPLLCSVLCQLHAAGHTAAGPLESHPQRRGNTKQGPLQTQTGSPSAWCPAWLVTRGIRDHSLFWGLERLFTQPVGPTWGLSVWGS